MEMEIWRALCSPALAETGVMSHCAKDAPRKFSTRWSLLLYAATSWDEE